MAPCSAARRVARTIYLGSAPSSVWRQAGNPRARPGACPAGLPAAGPGVFAPTRDALSRLADRLHYLNSSGDKTQETTRFWFDTRANLRREMEDRKKRFDDKQRRAHQAAGARSRRWPAPGSSLFDGVHVFTAHGDVPDDSFLRLVVLPPDAFYRREEARPAFEAVAEYLRSNGNRPRHRANRLLFLAPDHGVLVRLRDASARRWPGARIVDDVKDGRLNIDQAAAQAGREGAADRRRGAAADGARVLQVAAVPHAV